MNFDLQNSKLKEADNSVQELPACPSMNAIILRTIAH